MLKKYYHFISRLNLNYVIGALTVIISGIIAWRVNSLGLTTILTDQNAHLNFARLVTDSMTPGLSQIGFWPPLLHILMVPFVAIDSWYRNGIAGYLLLAPFLIIAEISIYKLCLLFTKNKLLSFLGAILLLTNPYLLYLTATPMMETLYLANLFATAFFIARWITTNRFSDLLLAGLFVSLTTLSRFEGILLVPLTFLIVFVQMLRRKKAYQEIEATLILFLIPILMGIGLIFFYGWIIGNDPLAFARGEFSPGVKTSIIETEKSYTKGDLLTSFTYLIHASYYMLGKFQVILGIVSSIIMLLFYRSFAVWSASVILFSPFFFDLLAVFRGQVSIYVPEFLPYQFHNERFGLYWIGLAIFAIILFLNILNQRNFQGNLATISKKTFIILVSITLIILNISYLYKISFEDNFSVMGATVSAIDPSIKDIAENFSKEHYDFGKILIMRIHFDPFIRESELSLNSYIFEANYQYWEQSLESPWLFTRWVVMSSNSLRAHDKIFQRWEGSPVFSKYYKAVLDNGSVRIYKIKEEAVRKYANQRSLDTSKIPSLNEQIQYWKPENIYEQMKIQTK